MVIFLPQNRNGYKVEEVQPHSLCRVRYVSTLSAKILEKSQREHR